MLCVLWAQAHGARVVDRTTWFGQVGGDLWSRELGEDGGARWRSSGCGRSAGCWEERLGFDDDEPAGGELELECLT
jgi:hypothetical protein